MMKVIGIIGGISWLSSVEYYRLLNEKVNQRLGGVHAAKIILYSVNFGEIKQLTFEDRWDDIATLIKDAAAKLELAGADCILIGANTMHKIAEEVQQAVSIPVIHIAEATATEIKKQQLKTVALLGTRYTMLLDFYKEKLAQQDIVVMIPGTEEIEFVNTAIYEEMGKGIFLPATREKILAIINDLAQKGAEGIILGCTEIPLLVKQEDCPIPVFDTTEIHAAAAVAFALDESSILAHNSI